MYDDDLKNVGSMMSVSVSVSGRGTRSHLMDPGQANGGGGVQRGRGAVGGVACGGGVSEAGLKPRGYAEESPNLYKKGMKGDQPRRRLSRGIQSQISIFENLKQGENITEPITDCESGNHVGRRNRKEYF